jgi:hypothetical protein
MPLQTATPGQVTWSAGARYGTVSQVTVQFSIVTEDQAREVDGDAALQYLVTLLNNDNHFSGVNGSKNVLTTASMTP